MIQFIQSYTFHNLYRMYSTVHVSELIEYMFLTHCTYVQHILYCTYVQYSMYCTVHMCVTFSLSSFTTAM
jgi:hypothetical protein